MRNSIILASTLYAATTLAHGNITSPPARQPGPVMAQVCGAAAVSTILADGTGPLESITSNGAADCNVFLCKGAQFEDNQNNVQTFAAGEQVDFAAQLPIPHEGPCNVSIIDTATNTVVGQPLLVFDSYADENLATLPPNNTAFSVTMPTDLGTQCQTPGECTMQWFWFGTSAVQTYENCVDFVMDGAAGGAAGGAATAGAVGAGAATGDAGAANVATAGAVTGATAGGVSQGATIQTGQRAKANGRTRQ